MALTHKDLGSAMGAVMAGRLYPSAEKCTTELVEVWHKAVALSAVMHTGGIVPADISAQVFQGMTQHLGQSLRTRFLDTAYMSEGWETSATAQKLFLDGWRQSIRAMKQFVISCEEDDESILIGLKPVVNKDATVYYVFYKDHSCAELFGETGHHTYGINDAEFAIAKALGLIE